MFSKIISLNRLDTFIVHTFLNIIHKTLFQFDPGTSIATTPLFTAKEASRRWFEGHQAQSFKRENHGVVQDGFQVPPIDIDIFYDDYWK